VADWNQEGMSRSKSRQKAISITREFPHAVDIRVPPEGLGKRLHEMHEFHRLFGITAKLATRRGGDGSDYLRWRFADLETAKTFAAEFSGELRLP
jgi:hypothetical protein